MYNNPFYIPIYTQPMMMSNLIRGLPTARTLANANNIANTGGLFSKLSSSLSGIKAINWGGLINNTSKTLGIINQTIPIVRQVGPMMNNMRSMIKVASLFKDETDTSTPKNFNNYKNIPQNNNNPHINQPTTNNNISTTSQQQYDESPTFFINS